jgi:hypothetical protein
MIMAAENRQKAKQLFGLKNSQAEESKSNNVQIEVK